MRKCKIKLQPDQVRDFVAVTSNCSFDIDVFYNRVVIDAKSILGVLGLDFSRELTLQYSGYDTQFEQMIHKYAVMS